MTDDSFENIILEFRRGVIILAVLSQLDQAQYGYALINNLRNSGLEIDQGTLYPLLRRLENQGLLVSSWQIEAEHPRRYYSISKEGKVLLPKLKKEWSGIVSTMSLILAQGEKS